MGSPSVGISRLARAKNAPAWTASRISRSLRPTWSNRVTCCDARDGGVGASTRRGPAACRGDSAGEQSADVRPSVCWTGQRVERAPTCSRSSHSGARWRLRRARDRGAAHRRACKRCPGRSLYVRSGRRRHGRASGNMASCRDFLQAPRLVSGWRWPGRAAPARESFPAARL